MITQRFIPRHEAVRLVKPKNWPMLEAGHKLSVRPGLLIQRVEATVAGKPAKRYQLTETQP